MSRAPRKTFFLTLVLFCSLLAYVLVTQNSRAGKSKPFRREAFSDTNESLISTTKCMIPNLEPFNEDTQSFFTKKDYISCSPRELLTYIEKKDNRVILNINKTLISSYSWFDVTCCYAVIVRDESSDDPDANIKVSPCKYFETSIDVHDGLIQVTCSSIFRTVYSNIHSIIIDKEKSNRLADVAYDPPSVLIIGIDSVSRLNLQRTMPQTYSFLENNGWINLKGYNKIDDNTFPNVFAFLTGMNYSYAESICGPFSKNYLDKCAFIWKKFQEQGYVTAYAEDWSDVGTFNYYRKGFFNPPTDFYFRPYFLASDQLSMTNAHNTINGISYCSGPETAGERILNLIDDFTETFKDKPTFGLFWMNTFSHNNMNDPTMMDEKIYKFMVEITSRDVLDNTIVVFLSDHGFRFGKIRYTYTGWLEERLPFIYLSLPDRLIQKYPVIMYNLQKNSQQLTNPYNLYATFEHVLALNDKDFKMKGSFSCPKCASLFTPIKDFTCEDISIAKHWCSCTKYTRIDSKDHVVVEASKFLLNELRKTIYSYGWKARHCSDYMLYKITASSVSPSIVDENNNLSYSLLLVIETLPAAAFEATILVNYNCDRTAYTFNINGDVSRLDRYGGKVMCIENSPLQKYCYCPKLTTRLLSYFCNNFYCIDI